LRALKRAHRNWLPLRQPTTAAFPNRKKLFVPETFMAPGPPRLDDVVWHHLEPSILEQDYQFLLDAGRNTDSISKGEDYELKRHQWEFQNASAFAYGILTPDEQKKIACVYINPCRRAGFDAQVRIWIAKPGASAAFDQALETSVRDWIRQKWPFKTAAYPGLDLSTEEWNALPEPTE
jgi:hypothetical protein